MNSTSADLAPTALASSAVMAVSCLAILPPATAIQAYHKPSTAGSDSLAPRQKMIARKVYIPKTAIIKLVQELMKTLDVQSKDWIKTSVKKFKKYTYGSYGSGL